MIGLAWGTASLVSHWGGGQIGDTKMRQKCLVVVRVDGVALRWDGGGEDEVLSQTCVRWEWNPSALAAVRA